MEMWSDQGIILSARHHGDNGAVVHILTANRGVQTGYVRGARGSKMRGTMEIGNHVDVRWQARNDESLGTFLLELHHNPSVVIMGDPLRLGALQSACALCRHALPERENAAAVYEGLHALFQALPSDIWGEAYVFWEIALLRELGFPLELSTCAGGGDSNDLSYVSPKTGRAVSQEKGAAYADKLLVLPAFLGGILENESDVIAGLDLTGYFLEHWVFNHHTRGVPPARLQFYERVLKSAS